MSPIDRQTILNALNCEGFDDWQSTVDVPSLVRPRTRPADIPGEGRAAAVMVLISHDRQNQLAEPEIILTRRQPGLRQHAGQISFPGGRQDPGETLRETALRETKEEIGVSSDSIDVLGQLNSVYIPPTDFTVVPFVGWRPGSPTFVPSEQEVAEILPVSVVHLLSPQTLRQGTVQSESGAKLEVPFYQVQQHRIWGATAIILSELIERLRYVL